MGNTNQAVEGVEMPEVFPSNWTAEILAARPLILPSRHFTYPAQADEVERGALEMLVRPQSNEGFLATFALGFAGDAVPTGVWRAPHPDWLCAVSGGYAYLVNSQSPEEFMFLPLRPVLQVVPAAARGLLLFAGHHRIIAWGANGVAWESDKLSDEGLTITAVDGKHFQARGWRLSTDREFDFELDWADGRLA